MQGLVHPQALSRSLRHWMSCAGTHVAPGGRLVFANCSLDMREGEAVAKAFLAARPGYRLEAIEPGEMAGFEFAVSAEGGLRTTPDMLGGAAGGGMDGFFAARFRHEKP